MVVVVGSIQHETNSFSSVNPTLEDFDIVSGPPMLSRISATGLFRDSGIDLVPTIYANALPSGKLDGVSFATLLGRLLDCIPTDGTVDGVWLHLHGAMEVDGEGSGDLAILRAVRQRVGPQVPIAVALDFHANNDPAIARFANIILGYRTAPHTDIDETQRRVAALLVQALRKRLTPCPVVLRVPLLLSGDMVLTAEEPMRSILAATRRAEAAPGVLYASVFCGQPWVDAPNAGASIVVGAPTAETSHAEEWAGRIGRLFWEARRRFAFSGEALKPTQAVVEAIHSRETPVFVSDSGDNTTAGAAGDDTRLLQILLARGARATVVAAITDPGVVGQLWDRATGAAFSGILGGALDPERSKSLHVAGHLLCKGRIPGWDNGEGGRSVTLRLGGVDVVVTERRAAFVSPASFEAAGLELGAYRIVVVKLGYLFPRLAEISRRAILALTPGASCEAVEELRFSRVGRPCFPLDPDLDWEPG